MSEFKFGYESQYHKIEVQIPVCLFGKPDSDAFAGITNLMGNKKEDQLEQVSDDRSFGIFKRKNAGEAKRTTGTDSMVNTVAKTSAMLLSSMVLAALKG